MLKKIDWVFLRRPLIIFTILIVSSLVFYFGGVKYEDIAAEEFELSKNALSTSHSKLARQSSEIALVDDYLKQYNNLVNTAFIGDERRLSWIESMKATNKAIRLPYFRYSVTAQQDFIRPGIKKTKTVNVLGSKMDLDIGILHEEDLFKLIDILDENVQSYFIVDSCDLAKVNSKELKVDKENIKAKCVLQWIHLDVVEQ